LIFKFLYLTVNVQQLNYKDKQARDVSGHTLWKPNAECFIVKVAGTTFNAVLC
jgi:hypothetical protein